MKFISMGAILLLLAICSPTEAKIYKYLDENGNLRFTNDITQVPQAQRDQMKTYNEIQGSTDDGATREKRREAQNRIIEESRKGERAAATQALKNRAAELKKRKAALEAQSKALKAELEALGGPPSQAASNRRLRIYNSKVKELNRKSGAHQKKLQDLEAAANQLTQDAGDQASSLGLED